MLQQLEFVGLMTAVYTSMEKMTKEQRGLMVRAIKDARKQMDFEYPQGKPELVKPTEEQTVEINQKS